MAQTFCILFQSLEQNKPLPEPEWGTEIQRCLGTGFLLISLICLSLVAAQKTVSGLAEENVVTIICESSIVISAVIEIRLSTYVNFNLFSQMLCTDEVLNIKTQIQERSWVNCTEERSLIRLLSAEVLISTRSL